MPGLQVYSPLTSMFLSLSSSLPLSLESIKEKKKKRGSLDKYISTFVYLETNISLLKDMVFLYSRDSLLNGKLSKLHELENQGNLVFNSELN